MAVRYTTLKYNANATAGKVGLFHPSYTGALPSSWTESRLATYGRSVTAVGGGLVKFFTKVTSGQWYTQWLGYVSYQQFKDSSGSLVNRNVYGAYVQDRSFYYSNPTNANIFALPDADNTFVGWYDYDTKERYTATSTASVSTAFKINSADKTNAWIGGNLPDYFHVVAAFGIKFNARFVANGGTGEEVLLYCYNGCGEYYVRTGLDPDGAHKFTAPEGKVFGGWNTAADGSGTPVAIGEDISTLSSTPNANVYLYAQWKDKSSLTVTNGNAGAGELVLKDADGAEVARESGGALSYELVPGADYTLDYEADDRLVSGAKVTAEGEDEDLPYTFTAPEGEELEWQAQMILNPLHSVSLNFNSDMGSATVSPDPDYEGKWLEQDLTITVTAKAGYMPTTYRVNSGTAAEIPDDGVIVIPAEDFTSDIGVYIAFTAAEFTVFAGVDRGSFVRGTVACSHSGFVAEDTEVTFTATPADEMFEFDGWYEKDGTLVSDANPYTVAVTESLELYARFSVEEGESTMTVNYLSGSEGFGYVSVGERGNAPGGSDPGANSLEYTAENGSQVVLTAMVNNGRSFVGWFSGGVKISSSSRFVTFVKNAKVISAQFGAEGGSVFEWEGGEENKVLEWRSKLYVASKPFMPSACRVDTEGYTLKKLRVEMYSSPDREPTAVSELTNIENQTARRLPIRRMERYIRICVENDAEVDALFVGTSMGGMAI